MPSFADQTLMLTGGTGSFDNAILNRFIKNDMGEICIFSRDEKKQDDMRHELQARRSENANRVKFYIGDVRNPQSISDAMPGVDYILHASALKQGVGADLPFDEPEDADIIDNDGQENSEGTVDRLE